MCACMHVYAASQLTFVLLHHFLKEKQRGFELILLNNKLNVLLLQSKKHFQSMNLFFHGQEGKAFI